MPRKIKKVGLIVIAWISTSMLALVLREATVPLYSMLYLLIFVLECAGLLRVNVCHYLDKKNRAGMSLSLLFTFMTFLGFFLGRQMNLGPRRILIITVAAIGMTPVVYKIIYSNLVTFFQKLAKKSEKQYKISDRKYYFICMSILMATWLPVWLAFYLGIWGYDVPAQMPEHMGTYTTHHPLLHTLMLQKFYLLGTEMGNPDLGVAFYTVFQMAVFASSLAYMMLFLYRKKIQRKYLFFILAFMAIFPVFPDMAVTATKDVLFCSMYIYMFTFLAYFSEDEIAICNREKQMGFIVSAVFCGLFRNNAKYAIAILLIYAIWYYRHNISVVKRIIIAGGLIFALMILINGALVMYTHATPGSMNEMLSLPYQQMARVYNMEQDQLSSQQKAQIRELMPDVETYVPALADNVKARATGSEHRYQMSMLYLELMKKFPFRYAEAVLLNTMGYWNVDDISCSQLYGVGTENRIGYFWMYIWEHMGVEHISKFPALENLYLRYFAQNEYQNIPILACLFNYGLYLWSILVCVSYSIHCKMRKYNLLIICTLTLLGTYLLGPGACGRYVLPFIACLPILVLMTFSRQTDQ